MTAHTVDMGLRLPSTDSSERWHRGAPTDPERYKIHPALVEGGADAWLIELRVYRGRIHINLTEHPTGSPGNAPDLSQAWETGGTVRLYSEWPTEVNGILGSAETLLSIATAVRTDDTEPYHLQPGGDEAAALAAFHAAVGAEDIEPRLFVTLDDGVEPIGAQSFSLQSRGPRSLQQQQMATWPAALPIVFDAGSYSIEDDRGVLESDVDQGRGKSRRRFLVKIVRRRMTLRFTATELVDWDDFLDNTIGGGALPFTWPHPDIGGRTEDVRLIVPNEGFRRRQASRTRGQEMAFEIPIVVEVQP